MFERLPEIMKAYNIQVTDHQLSQLTLFYEMMIEKNKVMNLTAITSPDEVEIKHFIDSLMIVKFIDLTAVKHMIDVGTGAGFPGIPLKIIFPHIDMVLIDSLGKRIRFLQEVSEKTGLKNIQLIHTRAEDAGRNIQYREKFNICVSRAVANLSTLSEYCLPFVEPGGSFISYKAGNCIDELNHAEKAVQILGGKIKAHHCFTLPDSDINRSLIVIKKLHQISEKYPRKAGLPAKEPL